MAFTKQKFGVFWSLPPDDLDWSNLATSRVTLVMLMLDHADRPILERLALMGCRVILRVAEGSYYQDEAPTRITARAVWARAICPVEAVIVGNEPENALDLSIGSGTWGQQFAFLHRKRFDLTRIALQSAGVRVISPAYTCRMLTETDKPQPGEQAWWDICTDSQTEYTEQEGQYGYHSANGNGVHVYTHNWLGPVDELRVAFMLQRLQSMWHLPLYVDEVGMNSGPPLDRMRCYIDIGQLLLERHYPYGARVEALIPFVGNGTPGNPPAWSPGYLMRDPAAYAMLGDWMRL